MSMFVGDGEHKTCASIASVAKASYRGIGSRRDVLLLSIS